MKELKALQQYFIHSEALGVQSPWEGQFKVRQNVLEALHANTVEEYDYYLKREVCTGDGMIHVYEVELPRPPQTLDSWSSWKEMDMDTIFLDKYVALYGFKTFIEGYYEDLILLMKEDHDPMSIPPDFIERETDILFTHEGEAESGTENIEYEDFPELKVSLPEIEHRYSYLDELESKTRLEWFWFSILGSYLSWTDYKYFSKFFEPSNQEHPDLVYIVDEGDKPATCEREPYMNHDLVVEVNTADRYELRKISIPSTKDSMSWIRRYYGRLVNSLIEE